MGIGYMGGGIGVCVCVCGWVNVWVYAFTGAGGSLGVWVSRCMAV